MYRQLGIFESKTCKVDEGEFKIEGGEIQIIVKIHLVNLNIMVANVN